MIIFSLIFQPIHACRQMGLNWLSYLSRSYAKVFLWAIPAAVVGVLLIRYAYPSGLIMIILEGLICLLIFAVCAWRYVLADSERTHISALIKWPLFKYNNCST